MASPRISTSAKSGCFRSTALELGPSEDGHREGQPQRCSRSEVQPMVRGRSEPWPLLCSSLLRDLTVEIKRDHVGVRTADQADCFGFGPQCADLVNALRLASHRRAVASPTTGVNCQPDGTFSHRTSSIRRLASLDWYGSTSITSAAALGDAQIDPQGQTNSNRCPCRRGRTSIPFDSSCSVSSPGRSAIALCSFAAALGVRLEFQEILQIVVQR